VIAVANCHDVPFAALPALPRLCAHLSGIPSCQAGASSGTPSKKVVGSWVSPAGKEWH
jgi:hypothetical protein